ncbi:protein RRP6-like 2 [Humulus lupulus]|uniref:protein RRP6-like 2 n=1 Tax=Humulus lupulus TaxID=3486 RepID=UPI002B407568|nr:protein RRP6-like 2 [Humulus lupulus]
MYVWSVEFWVNFVLVFFSHGLSLSLAQSLLDDGRVTNATSVVDDGFQLVCGKKKKGASQFPSGQDSNSSPGIKVATKDKITVTKPKIPFHIPSILRPQQEFKIFVNNVNQPFEHVWLQKSEDGNCKEYIQPLKQFSYMDFVDKDSELN